MLLGLHENKQTNLNRVTGWIERSGALIKAIGKGKGRVSLIVNKCFF